MQSIQFMDRPHMLFTKSLTELYLIQRNNMKLMRRSQKTKRCDSQ